MSNSDKEMRFFSILILAVLAIYVLAYTFTFVKVKKEDKAKRIEAEQSMAEYPTLEELLAHEDEITRLATQEGDIVYEVTDKTVIAGIMNTLKGFELTAVPVNPEDDKGCPPGGVTDALVLYFYTENEGEYWELAIDDYNRPADFIIEHSTIVSAATDYRITEAGYYTKADKVYRKIKSIMYNGTRIDLNEQADTEDEQPVTVDFEYNPEAIYTAEELDYVANEGYFTMDICVSDGKIFFADMKNDIPESHGDYYYESFIKQEYIWGYMDISGENRHEFKVKPVDPEYPYVGVSCIIGASDDRVYAMTFKAKDDENTEKDSDSFIIEDCITAFDMSGNVLAETGYEYDYSYPYEHGLGDTSFVTKEGTVAVFNGALALYDSDLNEVALNTDKGISVIYPSEDGNIVALFADAKEKKRAIYSAKDLKLLNEETISLNYTGEQVKGFIDDKNVLLHKGDEQSRDKIISADLTTGNETDVMDLFHSGISGYYIKNIIEINENGILAECEDAYSPRGSMLTRYIKTDETVAKNRKQIVVFGVYDSYLRDFNGRSKEYYADRYVGPFENNFSDASELAEIFKGANGPDVAIIRNFTDAYFDSGVLADVSELLKENELPDGIQDAFSTGGVLRAYPAGYYVSTLVTYKDVTKDGELSLDTLYDCIKQGEGKQLFAGTRADVICDLICYPGNPFWNPEAGICNFDGDEFKSLLKQVKNLDEMFYGGDDLITQGLNGEEYVDWDAIDSKWIKDKKAAGSIFMTTTFYNMYYDNLIGGLFGEDMVCAGFPLKEGSKSFISFADALVVNELSDEKKGALEFIKVYRDVPDRTLVTKADFEASAGALHENAVEEVFAKEYMTALNDVGGFMYNLSYESREFIVRTLHEYCAGITSEDEAAAAFKEYFEPKG